MTQNETGRVVPLTAQTQQILVQALGQVQFAAVRVITRLPIGNLNKLKGRSQPFPQLSRTGVSTTRFGGPLAFNGTKRRAQRAAKFELPPLSFGAVRQRELV